MICLWVYTERKSNLLKSVLVGCFFFILHFPQRLAEIRFILRVCMLANPAVVVQAWHFSAVWHQADFESVNACKFYCCSVGRKSLVVFKKTHPVPVLWMIPPCVDIGINVHHIVYVLPWLSIYLVLFEQYLQKCTEWDIIIAIRKSS